MVETPWRIAMASSIGTSHLASTQPCQDSHFHLELEDNARQPVVVLVAADGAGSAALADVGAHIACRTFARLVAEYFETGGRVEKINRGLVSRWIGGVVYRLLLQAKADGRPGDDYACTLLASIAGERASAFVQIGDGAMVIGGSEPDSWSYIFWPQHGEFANTTNFVTSLNALEILDFRLIPDPILEIAIFTDGLENLVLQKASKAVHGPFFDSMFQAVRRSKAKGVDAALSGQLERYLGTPSVVARTDDDKTLILASRRLDAAASGAA